MRARYVPTVFKPNRNLPAIVRVPHPLPINSKMRLSWVLRPPFRLPLALPPYPQFNRCNPLGIIIPRGGNQFSTEENHFTLSTRFPPFPFPLSAFPLANSSGKPHIPLKIAAARPHHAGWHGKCSCTGGPLRLVNSGTNHDSRKDNDVNSSPLFIPCARAAPAILQACLTPVKPSQA